MAVPHFALPFKLNGFTIGTVEQDTLDDITYCVTAILSYVPGYRPEMPDFGTPDQTFKEFPDIHEMVTSVTRWENRASPQIIASVIDELTAGIRAQVRAQEGVSSV